MPHPRLDWKEADFQFNFKLTLTIVLYVGVPTMGGTVGKDHRQQSFQWRLEW